MLLIFGQRLRKKNNSSNEILLKTCPKCGGDLELDDYDKWFTLFEKPVFPYRHLPGFYTCFRCVSTFNQAYRNALQESIACETSKGCCNENQLENSTSNTILK
jgi:hypothetical protein